MMRLLNPKSKDLSLFFFPTKMFFFEYLSHEFVWVRYKRATQIKNLQGKKKTPMVAAPLPWRLAWI